LAAGRPISKEELMGPQARFRTPFPCEAAGLPRSWSPSGDPPPFLLTVRPEGVAWCVEGDQLEALLFTRARHAEREARRLAQGVAVTGRDAKVNVHDGRGRLAVAVTYFGDADASRPRPQLRLVGDAHV
jgi:hypothetical protein